MKSWPQGNTKRSVEESSLLPEYLAMAGLKSKRPHRYWNQISYLDLLKQTKQRRNAYRRTHMTQSLIPKQAGPGTCNILAMFLAKLQYIFCPRIRGVLKGSRCQSQSISILSGWWRCLANVCSSVLYYPTINVDIIHSTFFQVGGAFSCWGDCQRKRCCLQEESQQHRGTKAKTRELFKPYPYPFHGAFTVGLDQAVDHDLKEEAQAARVVVLGSFERAELRIGRSSWKWRGCCRHWRRTSLPFTILDWWANSLTKQSPCSGTKTFC